MAAQDATLLGCLSEKTSAGGRLDLGGNGEHGGRARGFQGTFRPCWARDGLRRGRNVAAQDTTPLDCAGTGCVGRRKKKIRDRLEQPTFPTAGLHWSTRHRWRLKDMLILKQIVLYLCLLQIIMDRFA